MKQTKWCTPARVLAVAFVCLAALSCGDLFTVQGGQEALVDSEGKVVPDGWELVTLTVPKPPAATSRELTTNIAKSSIDYYEVIFREHNSPDYYSGSANDGEYLSVAVPPNRYYDVLLLAGVKLTRSLLAAGYINQVTSGVGQYVSGTSATGWYIEKGKVNSCRITMTYLTLDPTNPAEYELEWTPPTVNNPTPVVVPDAASDFDATVDDNVIDILLDQDTFVRAEDITGAPNIKSGSAVFSGLTTAKLVRVSDKQLQIVGVKCTTGGSFVLDGLTGLTASATGSATAQPGVATIAQHGATSATFTTTTGNAIYLQLPTGWAYREAKYLDIKLFNLGTLTHTLTDVTDTVIVNRISSSTVILSNFATVTGGTVGISNLALYGNAKSAAADVTLTSEQSKVGYYTKDMTINYLSFSPYEKILTAGLAKKSNINASDPTITVTVSGVQDLLRAWGGDVGDDFVVNENTAKIKPYAANRMFQYVQSTAKDTATIKAGTTNTLIAEYTFPLASWPNIDAYGRLYFSIGYNPYNDTTAGRTWNIRNGFNFEFDTTESNGSAVLVIIGQDPGDFLSSEEVEVNM